MAGVPPTSPPPTPDEIAERLRAARGPEAESTASKSGSGPRRASGLGIGMRISVELVTTIGVGGAIGWGLDHWLDTGPIFMVVFLILGGAAGVMNAYRVVKGLDDAVGLGRAIEQQRHKDGRDDDSGQSG